MSKLMQPRTEKEIRKLGINNVREEYLKLSVDYNRIINNDVLMCPMCGKWQLTNVCFYSDKKYVTGRFPVCKKCVMKMVEQRVKDDDPPNETKQSVQDALKFMDLPYDDDYYNDCVKGALDDVREKSKQSPFATYITTILALPQYKGLTWKDSKFGVNGEEGTEDIRLVQKTIKAGRKRFGASYTDEELMFLENEYQDWIGRYECSTKAQEEVFENLSICKLLQRKALAAGRPTKDIDAQITNWMNTGAIQPKQNNLDSLSDAQTFGTLIQKWEETRPISEPEDEFKDVDGIGKYVDVFYRGHASKIFGLDNTFSHLYENEMEKYTVKKPEYSQEEDSEAIFSKIFGSTIDEG